MAAATKIPEIALGDFHPIVPELVALLRKGGPEPWILDDESAIALQQGLRQMEPAERPLAVKDLIRLAFVLETQHGLRLAARKIVESVDVIGREIRKQLEPRVEAESEARSQAGRRFNSFRGNHTQLAPTVGERAPSGSKKAGYLGIVPQRV